jgi:Fe-S cluster biogenesis protein NfuA
VRETFLNDELLGHLLVLHDLHPEPVDRRLARLIAKMSTLLDDHGARVELVGVTDSVATVRLAAHGCGSAGIAETVRDALLAATPELSDVSVVSAAPHESAFVPLDKLMAHTSANGGRP